MKDTSHEQRANADSMRTVARHMSSSAGEMLRAAEQMHRAACAAAVDARRQLRELRAHD
jgi:hypothetical protein